MPQQLTFPGLFGRAADELNAREDVDPAREEHRKGSQPSFSCFGITDLGYFCWEHREQSQPHGAIRTRASRGPIPLVEVPALGLVVDVVLFVVVDLVVVLFVVVDLVVDLDNLVVDMVEQTVLRNQQGVRLERTLCS